MGDAGMLALPAAAAIAMYGLSRRSLDLSGAVAAFAVGWCTFAAGPIQTAVLLVAFLSSSRLSAMSLRAQHIKPRPSSPLVALFKSCSNPGTKRIGARRNWVQVLANGGLPAAVCLVQVLTSCHTPWRGATESRDAVVGGGLSFAHNAVRTAATLFNTCCYACLCGDTWASEVGILDPQDPVLITSGDSVPAGTNGGISLTGTMAALAGGLTMGLTHFLASWWLEPDLHPSIEHPQWPIIVVAGFAGLFGCLLDSLLGATLQYSGWSMRSDKVVDEPAPGVRRISGRPWLDNCQVNFLSVVATGVTVTALAQFLF